MQPLFIGKQSSRLVTGKKVDHCFYNCHKENAGKTGYDQFRLIAHGYWVTWIANWPGMFTIPGKPYFPCLIIAH